MTNSEVRGKLNEFAPEGTNELEKEQNQAVWSEGYFILLHILEPIIPHICWELSEQYFGLENFKFISIDNDALKEDSITLAITINGKRRDEIETSLDATKEEILSLAKEKVAKWLEGKNITKEIVVPNKLVNFVVQG